MFKVRMASSTRRLSRLRASGIRLNACHRSRSASCADVAAGRIDTALSAEPAPPVPESEVLFNLDFVCLVGSAQPVRARRFTLKQYLHSSHAPVETLEGQQTFPDRALAQLGAKRRVVLSLPFFVPAIFAIAHTDLILTVPRKLAQMTAPIARMRVVEPAARDQNLSVFHGLASATHY
jgi:DNA-binding transcriptional LysR family regulator